MKYIKNGFSNWYKLSGRSSRAEYWETYAFTLALGFVSLYFFGEALYSLILLLSLPVGIGLGIRRMHDSGASGWFLLVPIVNLIMAVSKSQQKENKWGPIPEESNISLVNNEKATDTNVDISSEVKEEKLTENNIELVDDDLETLENRLSELQELKREKDNFKEKEDKRKKEILEEIEKLKKELNE